MDKQNLASQGNSGNQCEAPVSESSHVRTQELGSFHQPQSWLLSRGVNFLSLQTALEKSQVAGKGSKQSLVAT